MDTSQAQSQPNNHRYFSKCINNCMKFKYATSAQHGRQAPNGIPGRHVDPNTWCTGPDPVRHDKYYAWLKHRSQARYRGEPHSLTWDEWESLWTDQLWAERGRTIDSMCLQQIELGEGWHFNNVEIVTRRQHFKMAKRNRQCN